MKIVIKPALYAAFVLLAVVFAAIGVFALKFDVGTAVVGGVAAALLHYVGLTIHHIGHYLAARMTGYPMSGVRVGTLGGLLMQDLYPRDEPPLPARTHIQRALGGPLASLLTTVVGALLLASLGENRGWVWYVLLFFVLENLLAYTLQIVILLSFNDGGTLWRHLRAR
ncbi:MAG: hypothetical protein SF123_16675 [Chloroflexota bacterium]|nr:hypothetical protein [Chloroflexota bacterium]